MTRQMRKCSLSTYLYRSLLYLIIAGGALTMLLPFAWMVSTSLKTNAQTYVFPPQWIPRPVCWGNYSKVWEAAPFGRFFLNTIFVSTTVTVGQLVTCSLGAYAFARLRFPGRELLFLLYLATLMVPFHVTMIPVFILVRDLNWIDKYQSMIIPSLFSPYGTFLLRQFFKTLPREMEEAVLIDGGGYWTTFRHIALPLSKPALATLGTFVFMWKWNDFLWPLIVINSMDMKPLSLGIAFFQGQFNVSWNLMMAASSAALLPVLAVFVFAQKYFVEGITLTGLKG